MPFKDIACHVWAIDGYESDPIALQVNLLYTQVADSLRRVSAKGRAAALEKIILHARTSALTNEEAIVYGGFRDMQNAPEHMWLEYNGRIYETMPGHELCSQPATPKSRNCPNLEGAPFEGENESVVHVVTFLTARQKAYLDAHG